MKTCRWYVSIEQPECGKDAPFTVKVKTKVTEATVDLCTEHKAIHDDSFARIRNERKASRKPVTEQEEYDTPPNQRHLLNYPGK